MLKLARSIDSLSIFVGRLCGPLYFLAICTMAFEVIARKFFNAPQVWSLEIVIALVGTAWMLSAAPVTQQNRHITVTVVEIVVSSALWKKFQVIALVISALAIIGLMFAVEAGFSKAFGGTIERTGSAFNPPLKSYFKILIEFALLLYLLQVIACLIRKLVPEEG